MYSSSIMLYLNSIRTLGIPLKIRILKFRMIVALGYRRGHPADVHFHPSSGFYFASDAAASHAISLGRPSRPSRLRLPQFLCSIFQPSTNMRVICRGHGRGSGFYLTLAVHFFYVQHIVCCTWRMAYDRRWSACTHAVREIEAHISTRARILIACERVRPR